jgi:hypothetical protein
MKNRLIAALLSFSSLTAFAQDLEVETTEIQVPGVSVKVRVKAQPLEEPGPPPNQGPRPRGPKPPPVQVIGVDTFDLRFELKPEETLRLISPEGAHADIWGDDGTYVGGYDLPCEVQVRSGSFYRVVMSDSRGLLFDRKVEVRRYNRTNVSWRGAPPQQPAGRASVDFPALVEAVKAESFGDAKLDVVRTSEGGLTVEQVGQLVDLFSFAEEQVQVVEITHQRIVDRQNVFKLYGHFTFDADKKKVKAILGK